MKWIYVALGVTCCITAITFFLYFRQMSTPDFSNADKRAIASAVSYGDENLGIRIIPWKQWHNYYLFAVTEGSDIGTRMIARKNTDGTFSLLNIGQSDPPNCSDLVSLQIPKQIVPECLSTRGLVQNTISG